MNNINKTRLYCIIITIYTISHGLMLFLYGAWWDDLLLWNVSSEALKSFLGPTNFNNPFLFYIIDCINRIEEPIIMTFVFRLVPFSCWLVSLLCFCLVVKEISHNIEFTLYAGLISASCGLNKCMILICCYHYTISTMLFMCGLLFFIYDYHKGNKVYVILSAFFWTLSVLIWRTAVLVVPGIILMASIVKKGLPINSYKSTRELKDLLQILIKRYYPIIIGLIAFAILYTTVLSPRGEYDSYYSIGKKNLLLSPITSIVSSFSMILGYLSEITSVFAETGNEVIILIPFVVFVWLLIRDIESSESERINNLFITAFIILILSAFPYELKGLSFAFPLDGYNSRVTSLAIYPISIICTCILFKFKMRYRQLLSTLFISISIIYSINVYLDYNRSWTQTESIVEIFRSNDFLNGKNIVVSDRAIELRSFKSEEERYYEYEGYARLAYGKYSTTNCIDLLHDSLDEFCPDYYLFIDLKEGVPYNSYAYDIKLFLYRLFNKDKYNQIISGLLQYRIVKADMC